MRPDSSLNVGQLPLDFSTTPSRSAATSASAPAMLLSPHPNAVESAVNQVIAKRYVKKQLMRWTPRGAHLRLQARVNVLNNDLQKAFQRWHPGLGRSEQDKLAA